ncbi:TetR/AcrR family transcriptional regulator [Pseudonocardia sp. CA-107938]|uniref:TetR/AcrR family transcriptional regulator n=1 Tax=Pseudonocardia sp. CA-107938 TaxID=3240021 RepID=UPI003D8D21AE
MVDGLRERKKQETRTALSWAATRLVIERGYAEVRIEDIADAAGVSLRTFRNYFSSKAEAVAMAVADRQRQRVQRIADDLRARPADEPLWPAVLAAVEAQFALGLDDHALTPPQQAWLQGLRLMLDEPAMHGEMFRVNAEAAQTLTAAIAERTGTDPQRDLYPDLIAQVIGAAMDVATRRWVAADPPVPLAPLLRDVFTRLAAGLPPPEETP